MASCTILTAVPVHRFYQYLIDQTLSEAAERTGKKYTEEDLAQGIKYHYYNPRYKKQDALHIRPPKKDEQLTCTWTQDGRSVMIIWSLKAVDENHTEVTNTQENLFKSEETEKQIKKFNRIITREITGIEREIQREMKKEAKAARRAKR